MTRRRRHQPTPQPDTVTLSVNGESRSVEATASTTLLAALRDQLGLVGSKLGCGRGECGSCTVILGSRPVPSCLILVARICEPVTTIEGLANETRDLRAAFADTGGFQCGFCTPGQIVSAHAYLNSCAALPAEDEIRTALVGNLCRCTGYVPIIGAITQAATERGLR